MGVQVRVINEERPIGCYGYSNDGFNDNVEGIHISWTYQLLTGTERFNLNRILRTVDNTTPEDIDYKEGWELDSDIYSYFLKALRYKDGHWKERELTYNPEYNRWEITVSGHLYKFGGYEIFNTNQVIDRAESGEATSAWYRHLVSQYHLTRDDNVEPVIQPQAPTPPKNNKFYFE